MRALIARCWCVLLFTLDASIGSCSPGPWSQDPASNPIFRPGNHPWDEGRFDPRASLTRRVASYRYPDQENRGEELDTHDTQILHSTFHTIHSDSSFKDEDAPRAYVAFRPEAHRPANLDSPASIGHHSSVANGRERPPKAPRAASARRIKNAHYIPLGQYLQQLDEQPEDKQNLNKDKLPDATLRHSPTVDERSPGSSKAHFQDSLDSTSLPSRFFSIIDTDMRGRSGAIEKSTKRVNFEPGRHPLAKIVPPQHQPPSLESTRSSSHAKPPRHDRPVSSSVSHVARPASATPETGPRDFEWERRAAASARAHVARENALHAALAATWRTGHMVIRPLFGTAKHFYTAVRAKATALGLLETSFARWSNGQVRAVYWDLSEPRAPTSAAALRAISIDRALRRWMKQVRPEVRPPARGALQFGRSLSHLS